MCAIGKRAYSKGHLHAARQDTKWLVLQCRPTLLGRVYKCKGRAGRCSPLDIGVCRVGGVLRCKVRRLQVRGGWTAGVGHQGLLLGNEAKQFPRPASAVRQIWLGTGVRPDLAAAGNAAVQALGLALTAALQKHLRCRSCTQRLHA